MSVCDRLQSKVPVVQPQRRWKDKSHCAVLLRGQAFLIDSPPLVSRAYLTSERAQRLRHVTLTLTSPPQNLITFWDVSPLCQCH